jgi:Ni,Fe-hydrogenase I cytochrome b subunit
MTALFLPPVVAALFWDPLGSVIIEEGDDFFSWAFDTGPEALTEPLGERFDRQAYHHAIIWFIVSFPVGWVLGFLVTLADLIRPKGE